MTVPSPKQKIDVMDLLTWAGRYSLLAPNRALDPDPEPHQEQPKAMVPAEFQQQDIVLQYQDEVAAAHTTVGSWCVSETAPTAAAHQQR